MAGTSLFVYDGYYDYYCFSLVDERGRSKEGKMEGIRDAVEEIRKQEGWPSIALNAKSLGRKELSIEVHAHPNSSPITETTVEISFDGGYTWTPVDGFENEGGTVVYRGFHHWQRPAWTMVRARCFDGEHHSLWAVWNVFPAREPSPH